jgi:hypothetical protein
MRDLCSDPTYPLLFESFKELFQSAFGFSLILASLLQIELPAKQYSNLAFLLFSKAILASEVHFMLRLVRGNALVLGFCT